MISRLQSFHYHKEQIEILLKTLLPSIIVGVIAPILFFLFFQDIPLNILYVLTATHFIFFASRSSIGMQLLKNLYTLDNNTIENSLKKYLLTIFCTNVLWSISIVLTLIYSDTLHVFILLTALLAIISAAMVVVVSIYHAIFSYLITILPTAILSLLYLGDDTAHYYTAFILLMYLYVLVKSSFNNYKLLEDSISQKKEIEVLNTSLEEKIQKAIEETKQKEKQLQDQYRMAQMGEMLNMIAHQWRQPLSSISSTVISLQIAAEIEEPSLKNKKELDLYFENTNKRYSRITEYVQFLSTTIDDFRDFFKPDKPKNLVNITVPINKALSIIESYLTTHNIKIIKEFKCNDKLLIYQNEIIQVILNIIKNAEDNFMEKNIKDAQIVILTEKNDDEFVISISDNGGGIPEDILSNIFDPYFSTKIDKNGTGIGLYMSKTMIEKHNGGKLTATNTEDGVMFKITLVSQDIKEA